MSKTQTKEQQHVDAVTDKVTEKEMTGAKAVRILTYPRIWSKPR